MEALGEIVKLGTKNKLKSINTIDLTDPSERKAAELYDLISTGQVSSDEETFSMLYPGAKSTTGYRKLKKKLRCKLINFLFLIDLNESSYSHRKSAYYECYKEWAAARVLLAKNAWAAAVEIAERILKYSIKYEFTELTLDLLGILRLNYGTRLGDLKEFEHYQDLYLECQRVFLAENHAELLYTELVVHYVNSKATKTSFQEKAELALRELSDNLSRYDSYRMHLYGSMIRLMISSTVNKHEDTLATCEDIISFFERKPYLAETPLQAAYYQKLICHCQLRQFDAGKQAAQQCAALIEEGVIKWFKVYEYIFILTMHTGDFRMGEEIFGKVLGHPKFSDLPDKSKEVWLIYEAYLAYLRKINVLSTIVPPAEDGQFKLGRFLNETFIFSRDKAGLNVTIIVLKLIFWLAQGAYGKIIDQTEAIEKYCNRHLKGPHTIRSYYFIRMLLTLSSGGRFEKCCLNKANKMFEKLSQQDEAQSIQAFQIEVIPYEDLWPLVLMSIRKPRGKGTLVPVSRK
jgi:hypothetical protein